MRVVKKNGIKKLVSACLTDLIKQNWPINIQRAIIISTINSLKETRLKKNGTMKDPIIIA